MAWSLTDYFPPWGDSGERPSDNFQYDGGDQVNEKHLDYLWSSLDSLEQEVKNALLDIDSDQDGVVDEADTANLYKGTDIDSDGDGVVNDSDQYSGTAPSDGTSGQFLQTDGTTTTWANETSSLSNINIDTTKDWGSFGITNVASFECDSIYGGVSSRGSLGNGIIDNLSGNTYVRQEGDPDPTSEDGDVVFEY